MGRGGRCVRGRRAGRWHCPTREKRTYAADVPNGPRVFVSHASADHELVDAFVDGPLRNGCNLTPDQIFYTSGEDTGVPSGSNLLEHVRRQVSEAGLVVAIITPTYRTRPVCIAELGAAWSRTGSLFPIALPGMARADLDGVLQGLAIRYLDDSAALDELHDTISEKIGSTVKSTTWNRHKQKWFANIDRLIARSPVPDTPTAAEHQRVLADLEGAREALTESEDENAELREQLDEMAAAKDPAEAKLVRLPKNEKKRFDKLCDNVIDALRPLPNILEEVIWHDLLLGPMPWPNGFEEPDRLNAARDAVQAGLLEENGSELLTPNTEFAKVAAAVDAADGLCRFLADEITEEFDEWFRGHYGMPPDLTLRNVWDALIP